MPAESAPLMEKSDSRTEARKLGRAAARGRFRFHLCDRPSGHARDRHRHSGAAEARGRFRRRRYGRGGARFSVLFGTAWALMQFLFSPLQGALSDTFRPAAADPHLQLWRRPRLRADGAGADARLAVRRPGDLRHHRGKHLNRLRLRRRRDAAGQARRALRPARRGFRRRLCARAGARRTCRQHFAAAAVLDRRGFKPRQRLLRACGAAGIAAARAPRARFAGGAPIRLARWCCCVRTPSCSGSHSSISSAISRMPCCRASAFSTCCIATAGTNAPSA